MKRHRSPAKGRQARLHTALACAAVALFASVAIVPAQAAAPNLAPAYLSPPVLGGHPAVGRILTCSQGYWFHASAFAYSWRRGALPIAGQASSTYVVQPDDRGRRISCSVTASNSIGEYTIAGTVGGVDLRFIPEADSPFAPEYLGGTSGPRGATTVAAAEADPKSGVDMVLSLGGVLAGHVTVRGTGAALAGIEVCASDWPQLSGYTCAETDTSGAFSFVGLYPATYSVSFRRTGSELVLAERLGVEVSAGATSTVEVALPVEGAAARAADIQRSDAATDTDTISTDTASVSGTVTYGAGSPAAHTQVCVDGWTACTNTNAAGEYTLGGLAAGTHNIDFSGKVLVNGGHAIGETVAQPAGLDVTLAEGEARQGVGAQLRLGGQISGTVVGASGQLLGNVQVCTTEPFQEPNFFPPGPQECSYTNSSASTSSASSKAVLVPGRVVSSSAFAPLTRPTVRRALHEIDFPIATTQPGALKWKLSFCSRRTVRHGRCVRTSITFAAGTEKVAAGTTIIRVRANAHALRALRAGQRLHVTARLQFQSALGGARRSRVVVLTVAPAHPRS